MAEAQASEALQWIQIWFDSALFEAQSHLSLFAQVYRRIFAYSDKAPIILELRVRLQSHAQIADCSEHIDHLALHALLIHPLRDSADLDQLLPFSCRTFSLVLDRIQRLPHRFDVLFASKAHHRLSALIQVHFFEFHLAIYWREQLFDSLVDRIAVHQGRWALLDHRRH